MMPVAGDTVPLEPGDPATPDSGYRSRYDHAAEIARPGYYSVMLRDRSVHPQLTAGTRIGVARFLAWSKSDAMHLLLDLRSSKFAGILALLSVL